MSRDYKLVDVLNYCITRENCLGCKCVEFCRTRGGHQGNKDEIAMIHQLHLACMIKGGYNLPW